MNTFLDKTFGIEILRTKKREAIEFAREYFKGKPIKAIEIGVFKLKNSQNIINRLNIEKIYLIDPYTKYPDYKDDINYNQVEEAEEILRDKIKDFHNKAIWIKDYSRKAINKIKEMVDFIYVDGNHEYKYVKRDITLYWDKLKKGGIMSGHDIQYSGVSIAVLEFAKENKLNISFGDRRDWWIIK